MISAFTKGLDQPLAVEISKDLETFIIATCSKSDWTRGAAACSGLGSACDPQDQGSISR